MIMAGLRAKLMAMIARCFMPRPNGYIQSPARSGATRSIESVFDPFTLRLSTILFMGLKGSLFIPSYTTTIYFYKI